MPLPSEEILNPQTTLLLEDIDSRMPAEEVGVLTESGRINKQGREIADEVYQEFLFRSNGDFKQVLDLCREAESVLDINDPDSRDNETLKIIQSVRGKVVYNAHRTWVEKQMNFDAYGMGDLSATNVMKYARILKADQKIDVYEEATNIEREREEVNEQLRFANERLQQENDAIVLADIESVTQDLPPTERKSILAEIKTKLGNFTRRALEPKTRRKIVAGALSTLAVAGIALGYVANLRNSRPSDEAVSQALNKSQTVHIEKQSIEELENIVITEKATVTEEDYLTSKDEIPDITVEVPLVENDVAQPDETQKDEVFETDKKETPDKVYNFSRFNANTEREAIALAKAINFIEENDYEHPSNMCGPLAISLYNEINNTSYSVGDFWLATPEKLDRLFDGHVKNFKFNESISNFDFKEFELTVGDFIYLRGGNYDHMITISRIDEKGKVYAFTNINTEEGFVVQELLMYDPNNPELGMFHQYSARNKTHGRTGQSSFYMYRPLAQAATN